MANVTGPTSTLPGSSRTLPAGALCDGYNCECNAPAVKRVQGETDSFGAEFDDYCQSCLDKMKAEEVAYQLVERDCEWCKKPSLTNKSTRDFSEGLCGPVNDICQGCRQEQNRIAQEEFDSSFDDDD